MGSHDAKGCLSYVNNVLMCMYDQVPVNPAQYGTEGTLVPYDGASSGSSVNGLLIEIYATDFHFLPKKGGKWAKFPVAEYKFEKKPENAEWPKNYSYSSPYDAYKMYDKYKYDAQTLYAETVFPGKIWTTDTLPSTTGVMDIAYWQTKLKKDLEDIQSLILSAEEAVNQIKNMKKEPF